MTSHERPGELPAWHSNFSASADVATATVHAHGTLDLFTVDLLQGAFNVLVSEGCINMTLDLRHVHSIDRAVVWCLAETTADLASRHGQLTIINASDAIADSIGDLNPHQPSPET